MSRFSYALVRSGLLVCALSGAANAIDLTEVPTANDRVAGAVAPNVVSPELFLTEVARGNLALENPSGIFTHYGYQSTGGTGMFPTSATSGEWNKTEPDKNTYLVLDRQRGADPNYNYGRHFLFQGHELGAGGYITRINLDADTKHAVTLMATTESDGTTALPVFDGSVWYPFSQRLLFSQEGGPGGIWQATLDVPSKVENLKGILGTGGFEGMQADPQGYLYIVEDIGGSTGSDGVTKRPNSFVYRFVPNDTTDLLKGGKMQVLQVMSLGAQSHPIIFDATLSTDAAGQTTDVLQLHVYGNKFSTSWVTIHDTDVDGKTTFDANALAKTKGGTPFKRPENGQFRPGTNFTQFFFTETGDTNVNGKADRGGFGALYRLDLQGDAGILSMFFLGDVAHTGLDNCSFLDSKHFVAVEDAGDALHAARHALDSAWMFDVTRDYSLTFNKPVRILAEGRDASATLDADYKTLFPASPFVNEGDNEITGWHTSNGDPSISGLIGARPPSPFEDGWRTFFTQQHGDNTTWELLLNKNYQDSSGSGSHVGRGK